MSDHKVYSEADGVVYRGRRSVHMSGKRVWIDDREVGVEVDNNGDPLLPEALPVVELPQGTPLPVTGRRPWWQRLLGWLGGRSR